MGRNKIGETVERPRRGETRLARLSKFIFQGERKQRVLPFSNKPQLGTQSTNSRLYGHNKQTLIGTAYIFTFSEPRENPFGTWISAARDSSAATCYASS